MGYEDFAADYTEVDPNNHFAQVTVKNTGTNVNRNETAYVYKDFGVGHFDECEHLFDMRCTNKGGISSIIVYYGQSNSLNDYNNWTSGIAVRFYNVAGVVRIYLSDRGSASTDFYNAAEGTTYYCTLKRFNSTDLTLKIYSDAARTTLLDTLTLGSIDDNQYRYMYCGSSQNTSNNLAQSGWVENLDLQEDADVSAGIKLWDGTADIELVKDDASPVKIWDGAAAIGVKLVAVADGDASAIRFYDGVIVKAFKKKV